MANISYQIPPRIPPITFFEPISIDPTDMMTDVEFLLGMLKKLNEVIKQTNSNTTFIDEYSGKIEELEAEMANLRQEMVDFEVQVNDSIIAQFNALKLELQSMIATALNQANSYTDARAAQLEQEIQQISVGAINIYDPTTGILSPLQTVIDNIYGSSREDAITATEYDALEITASDYDGLEITAFDYDKYAKTILMNVSA